MPSKPKLSVTTKPGAVGGMSRRLAAPCVWLLLAAAALSAQELSFVSINVWSGLDYKGTFKMGEYESRKVRSTRYDLLLAELRTLDPDVIALNEANPLPAYARRLARDLGYDYIYSVGMAGIKIGRFGIPVNFKEGDAILARKELGLKKGGLQRLSPGSGYIGNFFAFHFAESNQAIAGGIQVGDRTVYVVNTHLHAGLPDNERWRYEIGLLEDTGLLTHEEYTELVDTWHTSVSRRKNETKTLLTWLAQTLPPGSTVILMGDFNASPDHEEIGWVLADGYVDTYAQVHGAGDPGFTWDPKENLNIQVYYTLPEPDANLPWYEKLAAENAQVSRRIDYIFVKNIPIESVLGSRLVLNRAVDGQHPSDHFGVFTTISLNQEESDE